MVQRAGMKDVGILARLAIQMWTEHTPEDLEKEFRELAMNEEANRIICFRKEL